MFTAEERSELLLVKVTKHVFFSKQIGPVRLSVGTSVGVNYDSLHEIKQKP